MSITDHLYSEEFVELELGYLRWLDVLNYSKRTIEARKRYIREFLLYMERSGVKQVENLSQKKIDRFIRYLKRKENRIYGSGLMNASINVRSASVNSFFKYLQQSQEKRVPGKLHYLSDNGKPVQVLLPKEIKKLYEASYIKNPNVKTKNKDLETALQMRDRAMLAVYYGCGLRKSEGVGLKVRDIQLERKIIFVRQGKGSKQRNVPVTENTILYLKEYLQQGRKILLERSPDPKPNENFFINQYGESCTDQALSLRLRLLAKNSGSAGLKEKAPSLHTLRHSIATHLLQQGMQIEMIQQFLGHTSLETTQIYTHLLNQK